MKLIKLAELLDGEMIGNGDIDISGAGGIGDASPGQITFLDSPQHVKELTGTRASAVIVPLDIKTTSLPCIRVKNPRLTFARVLELFYVPSYKATGVSERASLGRDVTIGADCSIHPFAVIGDRARIGDRVSIYPGSFIGEDCVINDDAVISANVSVGHRISIGKRVIVHSGTVIGSDGFGFVTDGGKHHKIPQVGGVIIEDDVEIGANCSIDRATLGNTRIKRGTKLDNQVHVAHNVTVGEHCLLAGQSGIAGSSTLGNYVVLGGQAGVSDHTVVGDRVMAGGKSVITKDIPAGQIIAGFNVMPLREWLKVQVVLPKLPELKKLVTQLGKEVEELKNKIR